MGPLDALWHLLNLLAPTLGIGLLASSMAKMLWRRRLERVGWGRLVAWTSGAALVALIAGLLVFGRDGNGATYAAMVLGSALALWWAGFRSRP